MLKRIAILLSAAFCLVICALMCLTIYVSDAYAAATPWQGDHEVKARIITAATAVGGAADTSTVLDTKLDADLDTKADTKADTTADTKVNAGTKAELLAGLEIELGDGWHTYGRDPGKSGLPPQIDWQGSRNLANATLLFPQTQTIISQGERVEGYKKHVVFPILITATSSSNDLKINANVQILICNIQCIPKTFNFNLLIPAGEAQATDAAAMLATWRARVPYGTNNNPGNISSSLLIALAMALLGGFVLNLMPCVLPVLALKVMGVVKHNTSTTRETRLSFLVTALGIVVSFVALGLLTTALRAAGLAVGWGIQFQEPYFVAFLIVVLLLFAANLFDIMALRLPRFIADRLGMTATHGLWGDFASGAFATLLATPCTAPFLGVAVAMAIAGTSGTIILVFAALGLGMALPWLCLSLAPQFITGLIPRPGNWMKVLRRILGIALVLTALWLMTVMLLQLGFIKPTPNDKWRPFNVQEITKAVDNGNVVFVDITAAWCLTCQVNKATVLSRADVKKLIFDTPPVMSFQADWTTKDPAIALFLARHGRSGIPFNAVFSRKFPDGIILGEVLTTDALRQAISKASE